MLRKSRLNKSNEHLDRWLVSYADYMTLLFAVFVVLYAMAIVNEEQFKFTMNGLQKAFSKFGANPDEQGSDQLSEGNTRDILFEGGLLSGGENILQGKDQVDDAAFDGQEQIEADRKLSSIGKDKLGASLAQVEQDLADVVSPLKNSGMINVNSTDDWVTIELNSELAFPSGSATLTRPAFEVLQTLMPMIAPISNFIRIRGYTDSESVQSELFTTNWQLAGERAYSVLVALQELGVSPYRLAYESYGAFSPIATNQTETGRAKNRRVVIAISKYGWDGLTGVMRFPQTKNSE